MAASIKAEESRREAESANKSKSAFLATMSHEIRTPMNAIIGISEIQLSRGDLPDDLTEALNKIHASSYGLLSIINDILDLSKIETGKLELNPIDYDIPSLINDVVQLNIVRIGSKPIEFSLDVDENIPTRLFGDELRLKQILNNILSNAFKYTDKGSVKLSFRHAPETCADGKDETVCLAFSVADTGQGMTPENIQLLFEEYSRFNDSANRAIEGTGLGMSIARKLVAMMDGKIEVASEYGKGSTFTVTVVQQRVGNAPAIGPELAESLRNFTFVINKEKSEIQVNRERMPYGRVLVVDDVETNLYVVRGLLTPYGLTIETVLSGFDAIDRVLSGASYDIIFMDHMMPRMDGIEATREIRASGYDGVIVALTANAIAGNDRMFKENGLDDFISKPIDIRQMNAVLNKYIRDRRSAETPEAMLPAPQAEPQDIGFALDGVDTARGVAMTGGKAENYLEVLRLFHKDAEKRLETLCCPPENITEFITSAHALKSAAASIGAEGISKQAAALEAAGQNGDMAFISGNLDGFKDALGRLMREISLSHKSADSTDSPPLDKALLLALKDALASKAIGAAERILGELCMNAGGAAKEALSRVQDCVLVYDLKGAAKAVERLLDGEWPQ